MPTPCNNFTVPIFEADPCLGEVKSAACVKDSSIYSELSLPANSSQQEINQAQYLAALNIKAQTENLDNRTAILETTVDNLSMSPFKAISYNIRFLTDGTIYDDIIYSNLLCNTTANMVGTGIYEITSDAVDFTLNKTFIPPFGYQRVTTNSGLIRLPLFNNNVLEGYYWAQRISSSVIRLNFNDLLGNYINPYTILIDRSIQLEIKVYN